MRSSSDVTAGLSCDRCFGPAFFQGGVAFGEGAPTQSPVVSAFRAVPRSFRNRLHPPEAITTTTVSAADEDATSGCLSA